MSTRPPRLQMQMAAAVVSLEPNEAIPALPARRLEVGADQRHQSRVLSSLPHPATGRQRAKGSKLDRVPSSDDQERQRQQLHLPQLPLQRPLRQATEVRVVLTSLMAREAVALPVAVCQWHEGARTLLELAVASRPSRSTLIASARRQRGSVNDSIVSCLHREPSELVPSP